MVSLLDLGPDWVSTQSSRSIFLRASCFSPARGSQGSQNLEWESLLNFKDKNHMTGNDCEFCEDCLSGYNCITMTITLVEVLSRHIAFVGLPVFAACPLEREMVFPLERIT